MRSLLTARLWLEPQTAAHADEMFEVLSDPAIYEFENQPPASVAWLRARFAHLESRRSPDGLEEWLNWVVRDGAGGAAIGYVQATVFPEATALIAYEFRSASWHRGYALESVTAMLRELHAAHRVVVAGAVFKRANHRSRALLHRLDMRPAAPGRFPSALAADDEDAVVKWLRPG